MVFLLVVIALLAIPVTLSYQVSWRRAFEGHVTLKWLFGLVRIELSSIESKTLALEPEKIAQRKRKQAPSGKKSSPVAAFWRKSFRQRVFRFIRDLWHAIQKQNMKLRLRIGLGDPAETGQLWAIVGPVSGMLATIQEASIEIEPEFIEPVFELDSSGRIRIIPLQMIYLTIGLILSPPIWQGIKQMRQTG
jgi:hypothetical protein